MPEFLQPYVGVLAAHPYLFIFIGLLFTGELVLLPAVYLAVLGRLEFGYVLVIAIAATTISDAFWYYLGRRFPERALKRIPMLGRSRLLAGVQFLFQTRGPQVLYLSKFVYGTRVAAQVFAGIYRMPLRVYFATNTMGVISLTLLLSALAWSVTGTVQHYTSLVHKAEIAFLAFVSIAAVIFLAAVALARRRWSR